MLFRGARIPSEIVRDIENMKLLLEQGLDLEQIAEFLIDEGESTETQVAMRSILSVLKSPQTLAIACKQAGGYWGSPLVVSVIKAGEVGEVLDEALGKLVEYLNIEVLFQEQDVAETDQAKVAVALWLKLLGLLLSAGVPITQALSTLSEYCVDDLKTVTLAIKDDFLKGEVELLPMTKYPELFSEELREALLQGIADGEFDHACSNQALRMLKETIKSD